MTEEEQRRIFAKKLNHYIYQSGKSQKEVARALGFSPTTFNTWCVGKIMPKMGKVQAIADYFGILKSDLLDDVPSAEETDAHVKLIRLYDSMTDENKRFLLSLAEKMAK